MITLNTSMCGATANFPEAVMATLGGQLVVFDYTPDQAGGSGPGPYCEGYLPRDPQYAGMYEIFGYMPDDWYFFDGNSFNWYNDCSLINGVDGTAGFTIHSIAFQPESMPVVRTGSICRPSVRTVERALSQAVMLAPDPDRSHAASVVRLAVTRPIFRHSMAARFDSVPPAPTGFGNPTLDNLRPNLVCVWKLEEGAGTRSDVISGEDLSAHNAPGSAAGKDGLACVFSNAAANGLYRDLAQLGPLGAHESDTEIAFSTWVYANSVGYRSIAGFIDEMGGMGPWSLSLGYENRVYLNISTYNWNDYAWAQTGGLSAGQWYNLVFTFSATGHLRLYVNGSLVATNDTYSGTGGLAQPYSPFTLGCGQAYDYEHDTYGYGNSWDGLIDETCVWNAVPADPDAFAAALWNGGRGAFYRIDTTRRAASGIAATVRQPLSVLRRERFEASANLALTGIAARFDAVARLVSASLPLRSAAREVTRHERLDLFDCIFGETPARAAFAQRHAARQVSGSGFRHPVVDALGGDLVSLWRLDEASGQRMDEISGENVTPLKAPGGDAGMRDGAAAFDRALSQGLRRELADVDALGFSGAGQSLTVALWFRVDSNNHDYRFMIGFNNVENYAFSWSLSVGYQNRLTAQLFTHQWDELYLSTGSIAAGQWHLVVLAYEASANRMRLFVDGALAGDMTGYSGPGNGGLLAPQAAFGIGCCDGMNWETYEPAPTGFFHGRIDEAAVWRSAPADPVLFAASLWNSGQGLFYEGDPIRRAVAPVRAELRQPQGALHRLRPTALAETVLTGAAARFDAVAYRARQATAPHPAARCQAEARTPVGFEFIFGIDPTRATIAARPAAREMSGTGFGNSILDALMDRLVCCWKLEEGTGQRLDVISGENLTPHNTPTDGPGKDGQANRFSNAQANGLYRNLADLGPLAAWGAGVELAVSTWLYADSLGYRSVLGFIDEMGYMGPWSMTVGYQNRLYLNVMTPDWDNAYVQSGSLVTGQWQHVFFTYNASGQLRLYLNGVLSATGSTYNGNGGLGQPYSPFTLGCGQAYDYEHDTYGFGNSWDGLIDETCVWSAAPPDPDLFAVALWQAGRGSFLYLDPRHRTVTTARGDLRAATATKKADRLLADQDLARSATPVRALATRYTVETNTGASTDARARAAADHAIRSDAEYIVALTRMLSAVRAGVRRDMDAVNCARTVLGLDARAQTANASAAFLKALVVRLHADHRLRLGAGTKATFAASGGLFDIRAVNRVTTGEHPGARKLLVWTIPHLTSARDTTGKRVPLCFLARARQDALHPVRLTMRAPQGIAVPVRHDAFIPAGWRLIARNPATGENLDLGFVPANPDGSGGAVVDVALPDGDWQIEPRPAEWFWTDCMGRASTSVSIRDGRILHAGLPAILNLRGEILNQRRVVRWEIAAELLPQSFQFGIWAGTASPVDATGQPLAAVPFAAGRGSYFYAFAQAAPIHLVVAAMAAGARGPEAGIFLDWRTAAPASPANQLAR
jgi:hypothetical protein